MFSETFLESWEAQSRAPSSVSFLPLTEFWTESSVSSFQTCVCLPKQTLSVAQNPRSLCFETVLSTQYYGAQNDYTHIFIIWEISSQLHRGSVTQGFLAGILLCNSGASKRYVLCRRQLHTLIVRELIFLLHTHLLHKRIVSELFV